MDNTEADKIAYVQVGQPYGIIHLEGVKSRYIDCNGDPAKFWSDLTFFTHPDPLSYDYYIDYQRRVQFYYESVEAYNKAVNEYSRGSKKYSYSQLMSWLENIEELENDLGPFYKSMGTVQNVEMYWD